MAEDRAHLVFLHHSCGSNWLADRSSEKPNGGGLRSTLEANGFAVHDANYTDDVPGIEGHPDEGRHPIGDHTNVNDWTHWFTYHLDGVRAWQCEDGHVNEIIMFKTCFPGSNITAAGEAPGDPKDREKTLANYKAVYNELAGIFAKQPQTLFVPVTAPPLNPTGKGYVRENAARARAFNNWLAGDWLQGCRSSSGLNNVAVFDFFDVLTNPDDHPDEPNGLQADFRKDENSHPTDAGNRIATEKFIPFVKAALAAFKAK